MKRMKRNATVDLHTIKPCVCIYIFFFVFWWISIVYWSSIKTYSFSFRYMCQSVVMVLLYGMVWTAIARFTREMMVEKAVIDKNSTVTAKELAGIFFVFLLCVVLHLIFFQQVSWIYCYVFDLLLKIGFFWPYDLALIFFGVTYSGVGGPDPDFRGLHRTIPPPFFDFTWQSMVSWPVYLVLLCLMVVFTMLIPSLILVVLVIIPMKTGIFLAHLLAKK